VFVTEIVSFWIRVLHSIWGQVKLVQSSWIVGGPPKTLWLFIK